MKNIISKLFSIVLIAIAFSFTQKESDVSDRADDFMRFCAKNNIKAAIYYQEKISGDSLHTVTLKNF